MSSHFCIETCGTAGSRRGSDIADGPVFNDKVNLTLRSLRRALPHDRKTYLEIYSVLPISLKVVCNIVQEQNPQSEPVIYRIFIL
jgi:hypothetical protein